MNQPHNRTRGPIRVRMEQAIARGDSTSKIRRDTARFLRDGDYTPEERAIGQEGMWGWLECLGFFREQTAMTSENVNHWHELTEGGTDDAHDTSVDAEF